MQSTTDGRAPFDDWARRLLQADGLARMGHAQHPETGDLGLGWLYYGLARLIKPAMAVVIGSWRGFSPMAIARALADDGEGRLLFIDPSMVDDFWRDPGRVREYFAGFGLSNIDHHCMTTQQFVETETWRNLGEVGLLMVDGYHSKEQARFDHDAFRERIPAHGMVLFHDSVQVRPSHIYGDDAVYEHRVRDLMDEYRRDPSLQVFDLPFGSGLTLVRTAGTPEVLRA